MRHLETMHTEVDTLPPKFGKPHVVILGAGASRAACPNGDKKGNKLPLMNDLIDVLGLESILRQHEIDCSDRNFERLYSELAMGGKHRELVSCIENIVFDYFAGLQLPDEPTLYDNLVLSLRSKDLIATFNWDPFLWQALCRNALHFGQEVVPQALYLHGNVAIGYCINHKPASIGHRNNLCNKCGMSLTASRLLYPVTEKNYVDDSSIAQSWDELQRYLKEAYLLTIFGYRAPYTDVEAVRLMKEGWGDTDSRNLEEVEIIDIRGENALGRNGLLKSWKPFICREHYGIGNSFYQSLAAQHPRRSCEDFWEAAMQCNPQEERTIPANASWEELEDLIMPLIEQEKAFA